MLMRIWVLYACKLGWVAFLFLVLARSRHWPLVFAVCTGVFLALGLVGALLAIVYGLFRRPVACPNCGGASALVAVDRRGGVDCERCGLVTANPFTDFRFRVEPPADDDAEL